MSCLPDAVRVRWEIWESLVSMLRVYANAASLTYGEFTVTALADEARIGHKGNVLDVRFSPASGIAKWMLTEPGGSQLRGSLEILESGALCSDGSVMEIDQVAIEWVEGLIRAAAQ